MQGRQGSGGDFADQELTTSDSLAHRSTNREGNEKFTPDTDSKNLTKIHTVEDLIRIRAEIDQELTDRLTQQLCLLFADVAGSTAFYRKHGDVKGRLFIQRHNDIIFPLVQEWGGEVIKTVGDAVMASFEKPQKALDCALAIQRKLWGLHTESTEEDIPRTKITLHYGRALVEANDINGDLVNFSAQLNAVAEPEQILISQTVYEQIKTREDVVVLPLESIQLKGSEERIPIYEVLWKQNKEEVVLFRDFRGQYQGCFYCGLKEHQAGLCPSKQLEGKRRGLEALGYLPLNKVMKLFRQENLSPLSPADLENTQIFEGFYEISFPYQLAFLKQVYLATTEDWDELERRPISGAGRLAGTLLWRGLDCLRVGRYEEARSFFLSAANNDPRDYKPHVALGFWEIERENPTKALTHWQKALSLTQNSLQASYICLLMYRLYAVNGKLVLAKQELRKALTHHPYLYEAKYRQIALLAKEGREKETLAQLQKFIEDNPKLYLKVLLDPDFAAMRSTLARFLENLLQQARTEALQQLPQVTEETNKLRAWFPWREPVLTEIERALSRIRDQMKSHSYLGYRNATHEAIVLQKQIQKFLLHRKEHLHREFTTTLTILQEQLQQQSAHMNTETIEKIQMELSRLRRLTDLKTPGKFWQAWRDLQRLKDFLQELHPSQQYLSKKLGRTGILLWKLGLYGLSGALLVDALFLSIFGYRMYFSVFRPSEGEMLLYMELGAIGGALLGCGIGWVLRKRRIF